MGLVDPSIALSARAPQIQMPLEAAGQFMALKNAGLQQQLGQQQLQQGQYALNQAGRDQADDLATRAAIAGNTQLDPNTGMPTLNRAGAIGQLYKTAPTAALRLNQQFAQQDVALAEARANFQKTQLENQKAQVQLLGQLAGGVTDQASYTNAVSQGVQMGLIQPGQFPSQYDPGLVKQVQQNAVSAEAHITQLQKQQEMTETARHNQADEALRARSIPIENQAVAALGVPADQRTPAQSALISGVQGYTDLTKTQPGIAENVARVHAQPTTVVDPNNPGQLRVVRTDQAYGQTAPGSATHQASVATTESATSGPLGANLTSIRVANKHLDALDAAGKALKNGDVAALNRLANAYGVAVQNGASPQVVFDSIVPAVTGEIDKGFTGAGATIAGQEPLSKVLSSDHSYKTIHNVVTSYKGLLSDRNSEVTRQIQQGQQGQAVIGSSPAATNLIYARDPQGKLHSAPAGTQLPAGWKVAK